MLVAGVAVLALAFAVQATGLSGFDLAHLGGAHPTATVAEAHVGPLGS